MIDPVQPVKPIPYMGREQARKRLVDHRDKTKLEKAKRKEDKYWKDCWEERKNNY
jgi:hypothetical protein